MPDFARVARQPRNGLHVLWLLVVVVKREALGHLPNESLAKIRSVAPIHYVQRPTLPSSEPDAMIESLNGFLTHQSQIPSQPRIRLPVCVQYHRRMTPEQWQRLRQLSLLFQRNDRERATAAGFPVDRKVLWVHLLLVSRPCGNQPAQRQKPLTPWLAPRGGCPPPDSLHQGVAHLDQIRVPRILRYPDIVITLFLASRSPKDVPCFQLVNVHLARAWQGRGVEGRGKRGRGRTVFGGADEATRHWGMQEGSNGKSIVQKQVSSG